MSRLLAAKLIGGQIVSALERDLVLRNKNMLVCGAFTYGAIAHRHGELRWCHKGEMDSAAMALSIVLNQFRG